MVILILKKCFNGNDNKRATCGIGTLHTKNAHKNKLNPSPYIVPWL